MSLKEDADRPVTALTFYACETKGCPKEGRRQIREHLGGKLDGRALVLSAVRCSPPGCGRTMRREPLTAEPEDPTVGRAEIRRVLTDMGVEPRGF